MPLKVNNKSATPLLDIYLLYLFKIDSANKNLNVVTVRLDLTWVKFLLAKLILVTTEIILATIKRNLANYRF